LTEKARGLQIRWRRHVSSIQGGAAGRRANASSEIDFTAACADLARQKRILRSEALRKGVRCLRVLKLKKKRALMSPSKVNSLARVRGRSN